MNDDKKRLKELYTNLKADNYDLPEYGTFENDMADEGLMRQLYDNMRSDNYDLPDFNTFRGDMGYGSYQQQPAQPEAAVYNPPTLAGDGGVTYTPGAKAEAETRKPIKEKQRESMERFKQEMGGKVESLARSMEGMEQRVEAAQEAVRRGTTPGQTHGKEYDPATGQMRDVYYTKAGEKVATPMEQTMANNPNPLTEEELQALKDANRKQVEDLTKSIDEQLDAAKSRATDKLTYDLQNNYTTFGQAAILSNPYTPVVSRMLKTPEVLELSAAQRSIKNAQRLIAEADHNAKEGKFESSFVAGLGRGFGQKISDPSTWDMGVTDFDDNGAILDALNAWEAGKELTPSQQALLDAKVVELATIEYFSNQVGHGYKAGGVTAESMPLMVEMIFNPLSGAGKGAAKVMAKYAIKRFGRSVMKKGLKRGLVTGASLIGHEAGALAGALGFRFTTGAVRTEADALRRMTGTPTGTYDENGELHFDDVDNSGVVDEETARRQAGTAQTIEYMSEMFLPGGGNFAKRMLGIAAKSKAGKYTGLSAVSNFFTKAGKSKIGTFVTDLERRAQWHGAPEEFIEEIANGLANAKFVGDQSIRGKDGKIFGTIDPDAIFNQENLIDTGLGVGVMSLAFPFARTMGYGLEKGVMPSVESYRYARKLKKTMSAADKAGEQAFGEDWGTLRNTLSYGNEDEVKEAVRNVMANDEYTDEQKKAAIRYAVVAQGKHLVDDMMDQARQDPVVANAADNYDAGYEDMTEPEQRQEANIMLADARKNLVELVGEDVMGVIEEDPYGMDVQMQNDPNVADEVKYAVADYAAARAAVDGINQRIEDDAEDKAEKAREEHAKMVHKDAEGNPDGSVHPVTMKDKDENGQPREGYIVDGNIVMRNDGTVDEEASDSQVIVYYPATGDRKPVALSDIAEYGDVVTGEDFERQLEEVRAADVQAAKEAAAGKIQEGMELALPDGRPSVILEIGTEGVKLLNPDDVGKPFNEQQPLMVSVEEAQQMADAWAVARYKATHPEPQRTEEEQQPRTAVAEGEEAVEEEHQQQPVIVERMMPAIPEAPVEEVVAEDEEVSESARTYRDMVAKYGDKTGHKLEVTVNDRVADMEKTKKALQTAQAAYDDAPIGKEDKAEAALAKAQEAYDAARAEWQKWDAVMAEHTAAEAQAKAEAEEHRRAANEAARAKMEAERTAQEEEAARIKAKQEEEQRKREELLMAQAEQEEKNRVDMSGIETELESDPEAMAILNDTEPMSLEEVAANLIASRKVKIDPESYRQHTGYSTTEQKDLPFLFASPAKGGISMEAFGEKVEEDARNNGVMYDESDTNAGFNALLNVLGEVSTIEDAKNYIRNRRMQEALDYHNAMLSRAADIKAEEEWIMQHGGMSREEYANYIAYMEDAVEQGKEALTDEEFNNIFNNNENQNENDTRTAKTDEGSIERGAAEGGTDGAEAGQATTAADDTRGDGEEAGPAASPVAESIARQEVNENPTEAQKEAGNYKKAHVKVDGFDVTIENKKGSTRSGVDPNGKAWSQTMNNDYGYILGTEGVDGDHIDVFLSDTPEQGNVYVVDQVNADGTFDEHKVMYGFPDMESARKAYLANYEEGWQGLGAITPVSKEEFKKWIESSHRKTKPFSEYKSVETLGDVQLGEGATIASQGTKEERNALYDQYYSEAESEISDIDNQLDDHPSAKNDELIKRITEDMYGVVEDILDAGGTVYDVRMMARHDAAEAWMNDNLWGSGPDFQKVGKSKRSKTSRRDKAVLGALVDKLREFLGKNRVITKLTEAEKALIDFANGSLRLNMAQKRTLETARLNSRGEGTKGTVVSSVDGAKILKNLDTLAENLEKKSNQSKTFIGDVAKAIDAEQFGSKSQYATFETKNGQTVTIRLGNHNATVSNFDNNGEDNGISIVISRNTNKGITNNGAAHLVEFFYPIKAISNADGKPLAEIVRSIKQSLYSGEYKDTTGLAEREEVNQRQIKFHRVFHGSGADFERFDSSHMGEGEGAQAYGYGHYTTEVEGIGRAYAESMTSKAQIYYKGKQLKGEVGLNINTAEEQLAKLIGRQLRNGKPFDEAVDIMKKYIESGIEIYGKQNDKAAVSKYKEMESLLPTIKESDFKIEKPDSILYTVEIPDGNGSNYLEWDKPMTDEQIAALEKYDNEHKAGIGGFLLYAKDAGDKYTFENFYSDITSHLGGKMSPKEASDMLHSAGFTGIRYPAQYRSGGREDNAKNYVIFDDGDLKITDKVKFFKTPDGEVYGFTLGGRIYIDTDIAKADTPIHEYTHMWVPMVKEADPKMWQEIKDVLTKDKDVQPFMEIVRKRYPELTAEGREDDFMEEVLAHFSGAKGLERLEEAAREYEEQDGNSLVSKAKAVVVLDKVKSALEKFWGKVAELFGRQPKSAADVADMILSDLLHGVDPTGVRSEEKTMMNPRNTVPNVRGGWNERKIKDYLKHNSTRSGVYTAARAISEFDNVEELKDHMFYHGTVYGGEKLKPSITMSERDAERYGGGGYGERYWGISLTKSKKVASHFSGMSNNMKIYPVILLKGAKVIERPDFEDAADLNDHIVELWNDGVDAVWIGKGKQGEGEQELCVINPRAVVNIGTPDFYRVYMLGTEENPLRIADDAAIKKMYETAKEYASFPKPNKPIKPIKPFRLNDKLELKSDEEYAAEMEAYEQKLSDYEQRMEEYNNSEELRKYEEMQDKARKDIRFQKAGEESDELNDKDINVARQAFKDILAKSGVRFSRNFSYKNGSDYYTFSIKDENGNYETIRVRVADHPKPAEQQSSYVEGKNDFRNYKDAYDYLSKYFDLTDKTTQIEEARKELESQVKEVERNGEVLYQIGNGGLFSTAEAAVDNRMNTEVIPRMTGKLVDNIRTREADSQYEFNPYAPYRTYEESLAASKEAGYSKRQHDAMVERRMRNYAERGERTKEMAERLNLGDRVEVLENADGLEERFQGKKGWYDPATGKITVVLDKHGSMDDILQTILHEGVGHHGLRELFGRDNFDNFLDNVYAAATPEIRHEIAELSKKHGWNTRTATEEYMAQMAETMDFEKPENQSWWSKVKQFFYKMLQKLGIKGADISKESIGDNELRYLLWRSYQNLVNPGRFRSLVGQAEDIAMQWKLKVGQYEEKYGELSTGTIGYKERQRHNERIKAAEAGEGDGVLFRDAEGETDDIWQDRTIGMEEKMTAAAARLASNHEGDAERKNAAMRAVGGNLASLRKAMRLQKEFDKGTVKRVTDLARILVQEGYLDNMSKGEIKRLLSAVKNATGKADITANVNTIMDIMVDSQLRKAEESLSRLMHIRGSKVDARGVEVQGQLDVEGQEVMKVFKDAYKWSEDEIAEAMGEAENRMASDSDMVAEEALREYTGLRLALEYAQNIAESKREEQKLRSEKKTAMLEVSDDERDSNAFREYLDSVDDAIRQNKIERADAYQRLVGMMYGGLKSSMENAQAFNEAEKERVREIQHNANSDMEGRPSNEHYKPKFLDKFVNNSFVQFLLKPLGTFEQMMRLFGSKSVNGEGYLFNRFMRGWVDAREKEIRGVREKYAVLDEKVKSIFGKDAGSMGELIRKIGRMPKAKVEFRDGGAMREHTLTQGNLLYIYMVDKMEDGRMKLRKMGIDEKAVNRIMREIDPRLMELADWMQEEFLVDTRNEYNETHKRLFGAPMAAIENYFPLKVNANARVDKAEDLDNPGVNENTISTKTGSIIKRRRNALALDLLNADALNVVLDHVAQMEHWNAYAEFNRDLNTLRTYKRFRNQVKNMKTVYGSGELLWKKFNDVCQMAAGTYRPPKAQLDEAAVNIAKGVTAAKVSFRIFTALKQMLSAPAYLPEVRADYMAKNIATPWKAWSWAMENLPIFEERWKSRIAGDPRLLKSEMDWKGWRNNVVQIASRIGMSPNAFVDALTVSIGARTIYETRKARYLKEGYSEGQADKKAKQDAEMAYNLTQQSSEGAFMSTMQVDRSWLSVVFTVFRNASMSYQRQLHDSLRNLGQRFEKGYKEKSIEFMAKQMEREGVDADKAQKAAKSRYSRQLRKDLIRVATFGYILQFAWNLGPYLPYLLFGDDDDEKQKMWDDVMTHSMFGWLEGLTGGDVMSQGGNMLASGEGNPAYLTKDMPISSDMEDVLKNVGNGNYSEALNNIVNLVVQMGIGVNPQSITDAVLAIMDACGDDPALANEAAIFIMRVMQVPQSQIKKLYFDEVGLSGDEVSEYTPQQLAERYAQYQVKRGRLITPWVWDDEEKIAKQEKQAEKIIKERADRFGSEETNEAYEGLVDEMKYWKEKEKVYNKAKRESYVEAAKVMSEIQKEDPDGWRRYKRFKKQEKQLDKAVKEYMMSETPEEAQKNRKEIEEIKGEMVEELAK